MTKKLLLIATLFMASNLLMETKEADAQGRRNYNRGGSNRGMIAPVYGYPSYRGSGYSNHSYGNRAYNPYSNYSARYGNRGYGYPSGFGYGNMYGYRPQNGFSFGFGNSGFYNGGFYNGGFR